MGARPLRRAIHRYIEDPLADLVLREQVPAGSTVMVEPGVPDSGDDDVKLSVIEPAPKPTPVGVGAESGSSEESDHSASGEVGSGEALETDTLAPDSD